MRTLSTVEKALDVLFLLSGNQAGLGVTEVGARLGLKKSSAHQFLASLRKKEMVEQDPITRRYRLSPHVLRLSMAYLQHLDVSNRVLPSLRKLRDKVGETVILNTRAGNTLIHAAQVEGIHGVRRVVEIGGYQPLQYGAPAKAVLAFLPEAEVKEIVRKNKNAASSFPNAVPPSGKQWREELVRVRQKGYAMSFGQVIPGVHAMAAPVFDSQERVFGCVTISGPGDRFTRTAMKRHVRPLLEAAREISLAFGSSQPAQGRETRAGRKENRGSPWPEAARGKRENQSWKERKKEEK